MKSLAILTLLAGALSAAEAVSIPDAFAQGTMSLNARLRHESVQQSGLKDAAALTLRTRVGFTTAAWQGWKAMLEAENITAADGDSYNQAGLNPGGAGRAVIADPESTEINQAWVAFTRGKTTATVGHPARVQRLGGPVPGHPGGRPEKHLPENRHHASR